MHVPFSQREYYRQSDGSVAVKRIGSSPFVRANEDIFEFFEPSKDGLLIIHGEMFRVVSRCLVISVGSCYVTLMKESVLAQLLQTWSQFVERHVYRIARWEASWRSDIRSGEIIPWYSISGILLRMRVFLES